MDALYQPSELQILVLTVLLILHEKEDSIHVHVSSFI
jgi:hypothetical protein